MGRGVFPRGRSQVALAAQPIASLGDGCIPGRAREQRKAIASVIKFMRHDLARPVTLRDLADFAAYSPFHLDRVFSNAIGVPPAEFRAALRFDWAKHLLLTTDLSVTEICHEVGFDSLGTFSTRFAEFVGVTPKLFRRLPDLMAETPDTIVRRSEVD